MTIELKELSSDTPLGEYGPLGPRMNAFTLRAGDTGSIHYQPQVPVRGPYGFLIEPLDLVVLGLRVGVDYVQFSAEPFLARDLVLRPWSEKPAERFVLVEGPFCHVYHRITIDVRNDSAEDVRVFSCVLARRHEPRFVPVGGA